MADKISMGAWFDRVSDPATTDAEVMAISVIKQGDGGFDFEIAPDPAHVDIPPHVADQESALGFGNGVSRIRRAAAFHTRTTGGSTKPVLVSEMDSWGQFPFIIDEIVDHLNKDYRVWSLGAAGDTAQNMVFGPEASKKTEYMRGLRKHKDTVRAFVFSAAGNDVIGADPITGIPAIEDILMPFNGDATDVTSHIDQVTVDAKMAFLRKAYIQVIKTIRAEPGFARLPILIHGYDYPFPYPQVNDHRDPSYADQDQWLGRPMADKSIPTATLGRAILIDLIDQLYDMLGTIAGNSEQTGVWLVDCRGAMPDLTDWNDEIHGTSAGFAKITDRFKAILEDVV